MQEKEKVVIVLHNNQKENVLRYQRYGKCNKIMTIIGTFLKEWISVNDETQIPMTGNLS